MRLNVGTKVVKISCVKQRNYPRLWKRALNGDWRAQKCIADTIYSELYFRHLDTDGETMMRYYLNLAEHDNVGAQESLFFIYSSDQVGVGLGKKNLSEAIVTYCLVAIVQHDMKLERSTYEVLQILSISLTDKTTLRDLFNKTNNDVKEQIDPLIPGLFD